MAIAEKLAAAIGAPIAIGIVFVFVALYWISASSCVWGFPAGYLFGKKGKVRGFIWSLTVIGVIVCLTWIDKGEWAGLKLGAELALTGAILLVIGFLMGRR